MSNRRPPDARPDGDNVGPGLGKSSDVFIADRADVGGHGDQADLPADAATLGFADLAERVPGGELAEFRDLRARLFGNIDVSEAAFPPEPVFDAERTENQPDVVPFIPEQVSIANGALTAAEIAAAETVDVGEDLQEELANVAQDDPRADIVHEDLHAVVPAVDPTPQPDPEPAEQLEPELDSEPIPSDRWVFSSTAAAAPEAEAAHHRTGPLIAIAAAVTVAALVAGWFVFSGGDNSDETTSTPAGDAVAGKASKVLAGSAIEIDGESLRTSQKLSFDEAISQVTLMVPERGPESPAQDFDLQVSDIAIAVDGQPTQQVPGALDGDSTEITIDLDHPSDDFTVSYVASGAVVRTEPSSAHRAKALVTPVLIEAADGSTGLITIAGPNVLNLGCAAPDRAMEACGQQTGDGWEVEVPSLDTEVIAQVDLPQ